MVDCKNMDVKLSFTDTLIMEENATVAEYYTNGSVSMNYTMPLTIAEILEVNILAIIFFVGTFGNVLIITTLFYKKAVFKKANIFILNLAVADVTVSLYVYIYCTEYTYNMQMITVINVLEVSTTL